MGGPAGGPAGRRREGNLPATNGAGRIILDGGGIGVRIKPQQILAALGSLVLVLGLLFGFQALAREKLVNDPLDRFYSHAPGVQHFSIANQNGLTVINLTLGQVADLRRTYLSLQGRTATFLAPGTFRLHLLDHRDAATAAAYSEMSLAIQQGISTGGFVKMEQILQQEGKAFGLSRVEVQADDYNVYLQLVHGSHYLYAVVPRYPAKAQLTLLGGGG